MAETGNVIDPYRAYSFKLEIQGVTEGHFTECSGMQATVENIKYREGGAGQIVRHLPGYVDYAPVSLRYGLTSSRELWDWFQTVARGKIERRNVSILMLEADGVTEALRWNLVNAWPSQWNGAALDALAQEAAVETVTIVFDSIERD